MSEPPVLGRLVDTSVRETFPHEAHQFTVWLAQNLDRLSEALGITLELEGTEVQLGAFYADILARNVGAEDGADRVLIENQLEPSDHRHLGQILTYLAGAKVSTVVWISPQFREEHLSAIKWLNDNTGAGFSFFAVRLRTVRIGDSVVAPLLDVLEKPNDWERQLQAAAPKGPPSAEAAGTHAFWLAYLERHPDDAALGVKPFRNNNNYLRLGTDMVISVWVSRDPARRLPAGAGERRARRSRRAAAAGRCDASGRTRRTASHEELPVRPDDRGWLGRRGTARRGDRVAARAGAPLPHRPDPLRDQRAAA